MAKKTAKTPKSPTTKAGGYIKIVINENGTYDILTKVTPTNDNLITYAQILGDMIDGRFQNQLVSIFSNSSDSVNQQIGQFILSYMKKYKASNKPLIPADKVFKPIKMK